MNEYSTKEDLNNVLNNINQVESNILSNINQIEKNFNSILTLNNENLILNFQSVFNMQQTQINQLQQEINELKQKEIIKFYYDESNLELKQAVNNVITILNSIIIKSNKLNTYNVTVIIDDLGENKLGQADWQNGFIILNNNNNNNNIFIKLNDISYSLNTIVLLHETMHILGLVGLSYGSVYIDNIDNSPVYIGKKGTSSYIKVLNSNNINTVNLKNYIPIENSFGAGTAFAHFEEGLNEDGVEYRYINGVYYPIIVNELMTGFINTNNYLTDMCLGVLEDIGFTLNYESEYVKNVSENLIILQ